MNVRQKAQAIVQQLQAQPEVTAIFGGKDQTLTVFFAEDHSEAQRRQWQTSQSGEWLFERAPVGSSPPPALASASHLDVFTDGGCIGNPGKGGWAYLIDDGQTWQEGSGFEAVTTNNRMELMAVISALKVLATIPTGARKPVHIHTDSQYVRNGITTWIKSWEKNGWKTAAKEPVKNQDLWQELQRWDKSLHPEWHWVKGHAGNPRNERCDALVRQIMDGQGRV